VIVRSAPRSGVHGRAEIAFARRGAQTVLTRSRLEAPMAIVRPFALADGGMLIQLLSLGPGLCGGDTMHVDVAAGAGTRVIVTTTAATRVMSMDPDATATQHVTLRAAVDASLEYYPCVTIPYPDGALAQTIHADADPAARLGILECWAMGRAARAEYLRFRSLVSRTYVRVGGVTTYADAIRLEPGGLDLGNVAVLAARRYVAAGVWSGVTLDAGSPGELPPGAADLLVAFGQSCPGVAYLRALANDGPALDDALRGLVERISKASALTPVALSRFHN